MADAGKGAEPTASESAPSRGDRRKLGQLEGQARKDWAVADSGQSGHGSQARIPAPMHRALELKAGDAVGYTIEAKRLIMVRQPAALDDPCARFDEWAGRADAEAYAGFQARRHPLMLVSWRVRAARRWWWPASVRAGISASCPGCRWSPRQQTGHETETWQSPTTRPRACPTPRLSAAPGSPR